MTEKYINPFTDFGFKKLFGEEATKDLLLDFLNAVLYDEEGEITSLEFSKNEHLGKMEIDRRVVFDIYCTNEKGEKFIVEMQKARQTHFKDRSLFYATFPIQEQAIAGGWDFKLKAVYSISILDFFLDDKHDTGKYLHKIKLMNVDSHQIFSNKLNFVYIEMPKFKKEPDELLNKFEKWLFLLKHLPRLQNLPIKMQEKIFKKVMNVAELAKLNREERAAYEHSLKNYRDLQNVKDTYFEEGKVEGKLEGMLEGEKKGKIQTAINARKQGLPMDVIVAITQLSEVELMKIFEEQGL
jgi:predicted transposase/invertase (TIGR01784 family)